MFWINIYWLYKHMAIDICEVHELENTDAFILNSNFLPKFY